MAATADKVIVEFEAKIDAYQRDVQSAAQRSNAAFDAIEKRSAKMGAAVQSGFSLAKGAAVGFVASLGVDAITRAISAGLNYAASLGEVATQLGVTTDALQEYRFAGTQAGLATDEVDQALSQLTRRIGEGVNGTKAQAQAFQKLGIALRDANGNVLDAGDAIPLIADGLQKIQSPAERAAILMDLFGRAGQKLEPLLSDGARGVNKLRDAANELGVVLSKDQIARADETADKLDALKQVLEAKIAGAVADNADAILDLANSLVTLVNAGGNAIRTLKDLYGVWENKPDNLFKQVTGFNLFGDDKGAARFEKAARTSQNTSRFRFANTNNPFLTLQPKAPNFAGPKLDDLLGIGRSNEVGAGTGLDIKSLGTWINVLNEPAEKAAKKLDQWALEIDRATAGVALTRARLSGDPQAIVRAEKQQVDADKLAEDARILADEKNKSVRKQLLALNAENAIIQKAIIDQDAAARAKQGIADAAEQQLRREIDALDGESDTLRTRLDLAVNREQRFAIEKRMLDIQFEQERKLLEQDIAEGRILDATRARANLAERQANAERSLGQDNASPSQDYLRQLNDLSANFGDRVEGFGVDALKELNSELSNAIAYGGDLGDVLENTGKRFLAQLIELTFQLLIIKPLLESIRDSAPGGGFFGSLVSGIGGLFGGFKPRAIGGPVSAGRPYMVGEAGRELFVPQTNGTIIPNGQLRSTGGGGQQAIVQLVVSEGQLFEPRVRQISGDVSVQVVRTAAPTIVDGAVAETFRRGNRPRT